jgi:polynucleotide 5'-hydroxyl-kinase GRC3/NOL9
MFRLLETGGTVVVVGATDVGKTTFCLAMANACLVRGHKCAVVDADLGQSEIGPPATVGWGLLESPASALSDIECRDLFFVGSTSPAGRLLQTVVAVQRMNAAAAAADPFVTIVDMPGLAVGPAARSLFEGVASAVGPRFVVTISRGGELAPLSAPLRGLSEPEILGVRAAPNARVRSREERTARRRLKFGAYFAEAPVVTLDCAAAGLAGTSLFSGKPVAMDVRLQLETGLGMEVIHAEENEEQVLVVSAGTPAQTAGRMLSGVIGSRVLSVAAPQFFDGILVGLADDKGRHRGAGIVERVDLRGRKLLCRTPLRRPGLVRQVLFGGIRVRPDGTEAGRVDPAELYLFSAARR